MGCQLACADVSWWPGAHTSAPRAPSDGVSQATRVGRKKSKKQLTVKAHYRWRLRRQTDEGKRSSEGGKRIGNWESPWPRESRLARPTAPANPPAWSFRLILPQLRPLLSMPVTVTLTLSQAGWQAQLEVQSKGEIECHYILTKQELGGISERWASDPAKIKIER